MFIDGIECTIICGGEKPRLDQCIPTSTSHLQPTINFKLSNNYHEIKVQYNYEKNSLKVGGSIPYFIRGHNLFSDSVDVKLFINQLSDIFQIDISNAFINKMEFGTNIISDFNYKEIRSTHLEMPKFSKKNHVHSFAYINACKEFKIYDTRKALLKKINKEVRTYLQSIGVLDPGIQYLKVENEYKQSSCLTKKVLILADLEKEDTVDLLKRELIKDYSSIEKQHSYSFSPNKNENNTAVLLYSLLVRNEEYLPFSIKELFEALLHSRRLGFSRQNISNRRCQLNKMKNCLRLDTFSKYDLRDKLEAPSWAIPFLGEKSKGFP